MQRMFECKALILSIFMVFTHFTLYVFNQKLIELLGMKDKCTNFENKKGRVKGVLAAKAMEIATDARK